MGFKGGGNRAGGRGEVCVIVLALDGLGMLWDLVFRMA